MPYGYNGKILRVNLSNNNISTETPDENFYRRYFGGWGFISYYLLKELKPRTDPLGPENKLIFAPGVITGAPIQGFSRNAVGAKSPLTGGFGAAEAGGYWGMELKRAGFDAIIIEGKAEKPVYLWIHGGIAEIKDATHLWGQPTKETQEKIIRELGEDPLRKAEFAPPGEPSRIQVAHIGPGGEKLVRYACVMEGLYNTAGRTGMGAVMGSKNLKAVAVRAGRMWPGMADPEKLIALRQYSDIEVKTRQTLALYGTGAEMRPGVVSGNLPTRNFRDGDFQNADAISSKTMYESGLGIEMKACYICNTPCKKVMRKIDEPWATDPAYGGPEYETLAMLGSNCGVDDLKAVIKATEFCNAYSLDTISTGATVAFAMECFENHLLTKKDTGGIKLTFGNADAMVKTVEMICKRQGIGDLLAEGVKKAAEKIGKEAERFAVHVKGEEVPAHEPRLKRALGLGYAVSSTGADHMHNIHDTWVSFDQVKALGILEPVPIEDFGPRKMRLYVYYVNMRSLCNCMVLCMFVNWTYSQIVDIVRAVTGWDTTTLELSKVGERAINLARAFNIREGFTEKDDWLPERFFSPQTSGPLSKTTVDPRQLLRAKRIYYKMMGWTERTGVPEREKLEELDIGWAADELERKE